MGGPSLDARNQFLNQDALAKRVLAFEVFVNEILVDHSHLDCVRSVLIGEGAAGEYLDAEGIEIGGGDHPEPGVRAFGGIGEGGSVFEGKGHAESGAVDGHPGHYGGVADAGNHGDVGEDVAVIGGHLSRVF